MDASKFLQNELQHVLKSDLFTEKSKQVMQDFLTSYLSTSSHSDCSQEDACKLFYQYLKLIKEMKETPFSFEPYHQMVVEPFDYHHFGLEFIRPIVDLKNSHYLGEENLQVIKRQLEANENVILFANHQAEIDPQLIELLLEKKHQKLARDMIFVAGDRVISDHLAVPISMGRNLLCIHSKKHINNPPDMKEAKRLHNKKTMQLMSELLEEGGHCIYVAPSGGRDRPDQHGEFQVAPFDPQSVEMFYLMTKRAKTVTHFYPLALYTYRVLPPPNDVECEIGETRVTQYKGVGAAFGQEVNMDKAVGNSNDNKITQRHTRSQYIWQQVKNDYQKLKGMEKEE